MYTVKSYSFGISQTKTFEFEDEFPTRKQAMDYVTKEVKEWESTPSRLMVGEFKGNYITVYRGDKKYYQYVIAKVKS